MTPKTQPAIPPVQRQARDKRYAVAVNLGPLRRRTELDIHAYQPCGHGCITGNSADGTERLIVPIRCGRWTCGTCAARKVRMWQSRAVRGRPERMITLTVQHRDDRNAYDALALAKRALPKLISAIRRKYPRIEYLAAWQITHRGTPHVHMMTRGSYIPQRWLSARWRALTGSPIVDIRRIHTAAQTAKYVTRYMLRDVAKSAWLFEHRRIITMSRHWLSEDDSPTASPDWTGWTWRYDPRYVADILADWRDSVHELVHTTTDEDALLFTVHTDYMYNATRPRSPPAAAQDTIFDNYESPF